VPWCGEGYYIDKSRVSGNHPYHLGGLFYFQEPSAMAVVEALNINEGDFVLDLCAAPGGKATQAGAKLKGTGLLVANEIVAKRAAIIAENTERFGLKNTVITNETPARLAEKFKEFFDKIIVDAPCSGEGMFRKEPQAIDEWSEEHTFSCAARQKNIVDSAIEMLKPGGYMVYSTCTFAPCENEGVCDYILEKYPDMALVPINMPMLSDANGKYCDTAHNMSGAKRIFPHKNKGEGHFIALFLKKGEPKKSDFACFKPRKTIGESETLYREFEKKFLNTSLEGNLCLFGENLYLTPSEINLDKIKTVRAGLHLGICKKGRFEPSYALALALKADDFKFSVNFGVQSDEILKYLHGDTLNAEVNGWCAVLCDGIPLGWVKGSGGILKNRFPKYRRIL
ncbi:MAG: RsmB/NOP family class I SAM-dependent RNA methyltransferase, partial [Bacillota bacterium]|nr:RsmB/NOP family class I SAM-dependent RNA methyltransferase [Bacillota bacterium]